MALLPAAVIAATWLRLEDPRGDPTRVVAVILLALAPALVRPRAARVAVLVVSVGIGARVAFGLSVLHPRHAFGHIGSAFANGFLDFYDVQVPFDPRVHAEMRSVILVAVFGFTLALGLAVAARRPLAAALVVLAGAGWPATLAGPAGGLGRGVAILLAVLVVLGGLTARRVPRAAVPAAVGLALAAFVVSSSSAVAKGELVHWQSWDFYNAPAAPVSVSYVWNAQYDGLRFPRKRTTVLEIKAPPTALYWRAALLDRFAGDRWVEVPPTLVDFLEPAAASRPHDVGAAGRDGEGAVGHAPRRRRHAGGVRRRRRTRRPGVHRGRVPPERPDARVPLHGLELRAAAEAAPSSTARGRSTRPRSPGRGRCSTSGPA